MEILDKIFITTSFYLISLICEVYSFNFDTKYPIIYENPSDQKTSFGYSVILYDGSAGGQPWIQIGAPKFTDVTNHNETGIVYRCGIKNTCNLLSMPIDVNVNQTLLGNSMDISPDGSVFAVCGHKYTEADSNHHYSKGFCHWGNTIENSTKQELPTQNTKGEETGDGIYIYGQAQAGFSLHFADTPNSITAILGAPGVRNWRGSAILWYDKNDDLAANRRIQRSLQNFNKFKIPNDAFGVSHLSLFGYSVTSGYFVDKKRLDYAAGAPRMDMIGEVVIFKFAESNGVVMNRKGTQYGEYYAGSVASADLNGDGFTDLIVGAPTYRADKYNEGRIYVYYGDQSTLRDGVQIDGKHVGGQFGDTIASLGDIDFDGYEEIAVAATYEDEGSGTVYIYRGSRDGIGTQAVQTIKGKVFQPTIKGFGHAIARPRDIDDNNYNDLAIGAYKSEQALIFRARPVITIVTTFDNNNIRIPVDNKSFNITFSVLYKTNKEFKSSTLVLIPEFTIDELHGRVSLKQNSVSSIILNGENKPTSQTYEIEVKTPVMNIYDPIEYSLKYKFEENTTPSENIIIKSNSISGNDAFCTSCPVFDPKYTHDASGRASFNLGCGGSENKCYSKLHMKTLFKELEQEDSKNGNVFTIGSKQFLTITTEVSNTGDKAYQTVLSIELPSNPRVTLRSVPPICKDKDSMVTCTIANPLEKDAKKTIELELDMTEINNGKNAALSFKVSVATVSENNGESVQDVTLLAEKRANITITGRSKDEYYTFDNTSSTVEFAQVLQVQKDGPSPLENVVIEMDIPYSYKSNPFIEMYQPTFALKGQPIYCTSEINFIEKTSANYIGETNEAMKSSRRKRSTGEDVTQKFKHFTGLYVNCSDPVNIAQGLECKKLYCHTRNVNREIVEIQFKFRLHISNIPQDILGESDVIVYRTNFDAQIMDDDLKPSHEYRSVFSLSSVLVGPNVEKMIPIWIIIVAVLSGVLVLAVIAAILYKFGFFRREKKELLKEEMKAEHEATEATHLEDDVEE